MESLARTKYVTFRLGSAELHCLVALQRAERVRRSEAVRLAIREAAKARGLWPGKTDFEEEQGDD
jgi:DNA invertase Pin-like site-specific DNA recombinase